MFKRVIKVNVRCPRHPRETGTNPRASCDACQDIMAIRLGVERLDQLLRIGLVNGLEQK